MKRLFLVLALAAAPAFAANLKWAAQNDILTLDPHSQNHATSNSILQHAYEGLTRYARPAGGEYKIEPALATSWKQLSDTQWRFNLRKGVKFHDGSDFTADDVVFSFKRIVQPQGTMQIYVRCEGRGEGRRSHVDFIFPARCRSCCNIRDFRIMSKTWAEKNRSANVQDYAKKEETYASRNVNGTGPYIIKGWEPKEIVLTQNKNWWGKLDGNVSDVVYNPIKSDQTRVSALLAGDVDMVTDVPVQDVERLRKEAKVKVLDGHEVRTIFIGMDQHREELQYSNVKGKNPFKDVRVRRALNMAVDREAIKRVVMRGMSIPAGIMVAPGVHGLQGHRRGDEARPGRREETARRGRLPRRLRIHVGLPEQPLRERRAHLPGAGRYVGQGRRARAAERHAIRDLHRQDPELRHKRLHAGLGVATFDALYTLQSLVKTKTGGAEGSFNLGRISNAKLDTTIDAIKIATDPRRETRCCARVWSRRATCTTTCRSTTSCGRGR